MNAQNNVAIGSIAVALLVFGATSAPATSLPPKVAAAKHLTIGVNCSYPPAGYVDFSGQPAGYEIAIAKRIADVAFPSGGGLVTQCVNDANRIPFLQSGKVDLVLAALAWTPARAEQIDFSDPIWVSNLQLIVPKDSTINNYEDLAGKTVVTTAGNIYQPWLERCQPGVKIVTTQSPADASTMLIQRRGDAMAYIDVYAFNLTQQNKSLRLAGKLASSAVQGIGIKKDDAEMRDWLNGVLTTLRGEDAFFKAFSAEVKDESFAAKFREVVPGPDHKIAYKAVADAPCIK
ncbi:MAG: hypothetical protein K0S56_1871 [Microvirga sp.]|jgi:polar amino acid transport system substrate-binding protein|nr:hypothetical protein [Microvirga sp.]